MDCYDIGLWRQLALVQRCDLFLSPHTGFAFTASCVGTPWLVISGGNYGEVPRNGVPSYSVLPDDPAFPYRGKKGSMWRPGPRIVSMRETALVKKLPEIVEGAKLLLDPAFTYEASLARHQENLARASVEPQWKQQQLEGSGPTW